jgi:hypothetical protein
MKLIGRRTPPMREKVVVVTKEMQIDHCVEIIETSAMA